MGLKKEKKYFRPIKKKIKKEKSLKAKFASGDSERWSYFLGNVCSCDEACFVFLVVIVQKNLCFFYIYYFYFENLIYK